MGLEGRSVLVTGGTGFIGSRLVEKLVLEHDARVRVLVRDFAHAPRIARFPVQMVAGDITDAGSVQKAVQGCAFVFHCAYDFSGPESSQKQSGIDGTRNVCDAVLREGVARIVHVSTFAVYGSTLNGDLTESSPWQPSPFRNPYVLTKRAAERLVLDLHRRNGLPVVVLQPTMVYGPFSPHWTINPVNNLKTGLVALLNGGNGCCNLVYIDDVVDAMILAAAQPDVLGETFLISAREPVTWKAFYGALEAALGIRATIDLTEAEVMESLRRRAASSGTIPRLISLARNPTVFSDLASLPLMQASLKILRKCLSDSQWQALKSKAFPSGSQDHKQNDVASKPIYLPDRTLLSLCQSKTRVCIDKAKDRLGYSPKFDLGRGMDLTTRYIHWANLAIAYR